MKKLLFYTPICLFILWQTAVAQPICGFDGLHARRLQADPAYRAQVTKTENSIREYVRLHKNDRPSGISENSNGSGAHPLSNTLYTIPVVVHVVHTGGAVGSTYNPTDAQILGAIDYLNQVYNGTYPGTQGVGNLQIQFAVAKRDPNCNPTNGINRVNGSSIPGYASKGVNATTSGGTDEINVKNFIRWDPSKYYNIWVVDKIDGADGTAGQFIAGFAYFPGGDPNYDGIIMLATQMVQGQKTLPHEIGHAFNLYHPFEGSSAAANCPANVDCSSDGDQVCDTDPISYNQTGGIVDFTCRTGINTCSGTAYSSNTESNYMNYTSCYSLFTAGQKTRMLASAASTARIGLSQSSGATAPDATCPPKINFELSSDQVTESTSASSGCRSYKDYTYNMVIGTAATATATASLTVTGGTATEKVDFDITTNGNFSSPSKILTFLSGSTVSQPFTVRIYDDASVESAESFTLGFTVNNGGGNALAGDGRPTLTITIADNDKAPVSGSTTGNGIIGTAAYAIDVVPFDGSIQSERVQFLYKAGELTAAGIPAGTLSSLSLSIQTKLSTRPFVGFTIKLGTTTAPYLVDGAVTPGAGMTTVKSVASLNTVAGWNNFLFDAPYTWDGTSNLVVELCFNNSTAASDAADQLLAYSDGGNSDQGNMFWQTGIDCSEDFNSINYFGNGIKPIIKFKYGISATAVQTALNSSGQEYLGANADVYFYDQADKKLLARINNLSNFDYGCTQIVIDRAGTSASQFWNTNTSNYILNKTFHVIPSTNNSSGSYQITLYYTQAEINGWQTATGQLLSNIALIKTTNVISNVTPANPTGAGSMVTGTPTISSLGTSTALTYNFTTGFSGFGAGVVGIILPVTLLDFAGKLNNGHVALSWTTSSEINSSRFDIERSYDGTNFVFVGSLDAAGNSNQSLQYNFRDPAPAHSANYYRLKQFDNNGNSSYSRIVLIEQTTNGIFKVVNNPFTTSLDLQLGKEVQGPVQIILLDITGKEIYTHSTPGNGESTLHVDLSGKNLSTGMYILQAFYSNEQHVAKVIKQ